MRRYEETVECPYCGALCDNAEFVHIDFGHYVQATPFGCEWCGASQCSPYDQHRSLRERVYGWYPPQWGGFALWVRVWVEAIYRWYVCRFPPAWSCVHGYTDSDECPDCRH